MSGRFSSKSFSYFSLKSPIWRFKLQVAKLATSRIYHQFGKKKNDKHLHISHANIWECLRGGFGVHQAPPIPPKKVRKFCCLDPLNGELRRQTPMDLKSGITSKTKLPQQKWTHLQNLCVKVDQMAYAKSLKIFMRQEQRNFDM